MKLSIVFAISVLLASFDAHANAALKMRGSIDSFTKEYILIKNDAGIYHVRRSKLGPLYKSDALIPGKDVEITVPIKAIEQFRPAQASPSAHFKTIKGTLGKTTYAVRMPSKK